MYIKESGRLPSKSVFSSRDEPSPRQWEHGFDECYTGPHPCYIAFHQVRCLMFFRRLLVAGFLLIFTATAASAYTVVMRNGRRVEIPNSFTLTKSTLTYETAPGIQVTLQLTTIDIAATERVNGLAAGTFLNLASKPEAPAPAQPQRPTATRSITNKDVEVYRRARIESE